MIEGKYDQVVSIEMIEAVGQSYWPTYFSKISGSLKLGGRAVIQGITIREDLFREYSAGTDFIQKYIFPGGMLLTNNVFQNQTGSGLKLEETRSLRDSYQRTLASWRSRFIESQPEIEKLGFDRKFQRMWELYLAYCEGAFSAGRIDVAQFALRKTS
jgi:cyclopropane-fatty-acyl-phospholipid synthase